MLLREVSDFEKNADLDEVRIEVEAQIQTVFSLGIEPTHLDSHAGSILGLYNNRDFLEVIFTYVKNMRFHFACLSGYWNTRVLARKNKYLDKGYI
ncbi:ChbG/HpnK family deacetylase [Paenibacillus sp. FSL L8-0463]|uniref:ChbG/HpnK family deacetylase n=1 Tax=Paenibacillus sp. FSL L8-0463 TaxID=2954687 RepID=UPI0040544F0B